MFESKHFELHETAPGVWAAIHKLGGWAIGNAGMVDLGDETLIFDTHMTPAAGADLRVAAETLTGRPPSIVILSHYHNDHIWGAQAFRPEATLYATHDSKTLIETEGLEEYEYFKKAGPERLAELQAQAAAGAADPGLNLMLPYYTGVVESMPVLEVQSPQVTFSDQLVFQGARRQAELLTYGGGHTASDAFLYLPEEGILFLSDLLFVDSMPFLADGNPWELVRILDKIGTLDAQILVPGHGPVGGPQKIQELKNYIAAVDRAVAEDAARGGTRESILAIPIPGQAADWEMPMFHSANLKFFCDHYVNPAET